jgi:riboflavin kinase/FMN adenylyltransferase
MEITHGIPHYVQAVALTIGNFDGVHIGHQRILARLKAQAQAMRLPSCVLTFEPHPREFFSPRAALPRLTHLRDKLQIFDQLGMDYTHVCHFDAPFSRLGAQEFIRRIIHRGLHTQWLLIGDDFRFGAHRTGDFSLLQTEGRKWGFEVAIMETVCINNERVSSSVVRSALQSGDMPRARELLGRNFCISGHVIHGNKLGRALGFPTANVGLKSDRLPLSGIFAVMAHLDDNRSLAGVASIGTRPTVTQGSETTLEVHLFDFDSELYGQHIRVEFLHKLRDEEKYSSLEALILQMERDVADAKNYLSALDKPVYSELP